MLALPRDLKHDTWRRSALISAGGPIASWILVAICFYLASSTSFSGFTAAAVPFEGVSATPAFRERQEDARRVLAAAFGAYSLAVALGSSWPASLKGAWQNDASQVAALSVIRPVTPMLRAAPELGRALWSYDVPTHAFEPWLSEALKSRAARQEAFDRFLDALFDGDESALRNGVERLTAAHSKTSEAFIAQGLVAAWLDSDARRADDCLSSTRDLSDRDVMCARNLALSMVLRLEGEREASGHKLDTLLRSRPPWLHRATPLIQRIRESIGQPAPLAAGASSATRSPQDDGPHPTTPSITKSPTT